MSHQNVGLGLDPEHYILHGVHYILLMYIHQYYVTQFGLDTLLLSVLFAHMQLSH